MDKPHSEILLYKTRDGKTRLEVKMESGTVWLSQKQMAELFDCSPDNIGLHLKNIFKTAELSEKLVAEDFSVTASDGKKYKIKHYNLDAIISVGYRVNSKRGTQFRIWATQRLKEYIVKGFALDDERLKDGRRSRYFEELVERVRDIRTSERNFYQKITDIYATSVDYEPDSLLTRNFFATVQNKMHYGIHGKTAAEVIAQRADAKKPNMGITCIPSNKIRRSDIFIAKNYLTKDELKELNLLADQYLSFAELQAYKKKPMRMEDWIQKVDDFLRFNEKEILKNKGMISHKIAEKVAETEYGKYKKQADKKYVSDFDRTVKKYLS